MSAKEQAKKGLDSAFVLGYNYSWIRDKLVINNLISKELDSFLKLLYEKTHVRFREDERADFLIMLQAESITMCVKYCEDLAAISIAFGKGHFQINDTLKDYQTRNIRDFFNKISDFDYTYFQNILGYPKIEEIKCTQQKDFINSIERVKKYYSEAKAFYDKNYDLYNCYKHGLRLMPVNADDGGHELLKFPSKRNKELEIEVFGSNELAEEYSNALSVTGTIFTLLEVIFLNHRAWYFENKGNYECNVL